MGGTSHSKHASDSRSSSSSSAPSKEHVRSHDTKATALATIPRKSPAGEAWPESVNLPRDLQGIVNDYHASHFDVSRYSLDHCKSFTLFNNSAVPAFYAFKIGEHALHGRRTRKQEWINIV
jgi:hypothetical protein